MCHDAYLLSASQIWKRRRADLVVVGALASSIGAPLSASRSRSSHGTGQCTNCCSRYAAQTPHGPPIRSFVSTIGGRLCCASLRKAISCLREGEGLETRRTDQLRSPAAGCLSRTDYWAVRAPAAGQDSTPAEKGV